MELASFRRAGREAATRHALESPRTQPLERANGALSPPLLLCLLLLLGPQPPPAPTDAPPLPGPPPPCRPQTHPGPHQSPPVSSHLLQSLLPPSHPPHARPPPPWAGLLPGLRSLRAISHPQNALLSSARHHGSSINLHGHVGQQHAQSIFWELGPGDPTPGPPLPLALPHRQPALAAVPAAPGPQPLFLPASARPSLFGSLLFLAPAWPALRPRQCGLLFLPSLPSLHLHTAKSYLPFPALPEGHLLLG